MFSCLIGNESCGAEVCQGPSPGNSDFFLHAAGWLAEERDLISIATKEPTLRPFVPNPLQERVLLYVQVIFLPGLAFLAGIIVWRKRRRL